MDLSALTGTGIGRSSSGSQKTQGEVSQEDFLKMMVAQLRNQDPLNPMDNTEFLSQIAQFTTATGIQDMQQSFKEFQNTINSQQTLQAASLVGREVLIESDRAFLPAEGSLSALIFTPTAVSNLKVGVYTESGVLVKEVQLGVQAAGDINFEWDGTDAAGSRVEPGRYVLKASSVIDGTETALGTLASARVDSVTMGFMGAQPTLNLAGLGNVSLASVQEIR